MEGTEGSRPEPQHGSWSTRFRSLIGLIGREREKPPVASLADYLLQAAGKEPYALETQPREFDLGKIGHEAEKLMQLTLKHPRRIEYGTLVFVDKTNGRLLMLRIQGDENGVEFPINDIHINRKGNRLSAARMSDDDRWLSPPRLDDKKTDPRLALDIHSHPLDKPFSPNDLSPLFEQPIFRDIDPAILVVTPTAKVLALRTTRTPLLLPGSLNRYSKRTHARYDPQEQNYTDFLNQPGGYQRMFWLTRLAQEFHLKIYSCPIGKNIARAAN